ncbi:hypothetical protein ES703_44772 [subsurface metagenome]
MNFIFFKQRIIVKNFTFFDIENVSVIIDKLIHIFVSCADVGVDTIFRGFFCECADYVVSLETVQPQYRDIHRLENLLDSIYLQGHIVGHRRAVGFVFGVNFASESRGLAVHCHNEHIGVLTLDEA